MSSSCLSAATIVRCETLTRLQNGIIFVPVVVQVVLLVVLSALYWHSGKRRHFLLLADGWAFYAVALLDLLSHLIPESRIQLQVFKVFDIVIAVLSFVPLLLYTIFLFVFARSYFFLSFPRIARTIIKYFLLVLIPLTVVMAELGSFLGISYMTSLDAQGETFLLIGFRSSEDETLWRTFTSFSLGFLIIFQALTFCLSFFVIVSLYQERRTGQNYFGGYEVPTLGGVSWIAIGVKIGAVETILGFVNGGFPVILARRILRLICRCCLAYGSLQSDGATLGRANPQRRTRARTMSEIRAMISNPRTSTFTHLTPPTEQYYGLPGEAGGLIEQIPGHMEGTAGRGPIPRPQRVTVLYDGRHAPELVVRLSDLNVPPAEVLTATFDRRGTMVIERGRENAYSTKSSRSITRTQSAIASASAPMFDSVNFPRELRPAFFAKGSTTEAVLSSTSSRLYPTFPNAQGDDEKSGAFSNVAGHKRFMSSSSLTSDSLSVINALSAQFKGIPQRRTISGRRTNDRDDRVLDGVSEVTEKTESGVSPRNSIKRKPPPILRSDAINAVPSKPNATSKSVRQENLDGTGTHSQSSSFRRKGMSIPPPIDSTIAKPTTRNVQVTHGDTATSPRDNLWIDRVPSYRNGSERSARTSPQARSSEMTHASGASATETDTDLVTVRDGETAIDLFHSSDEEVDDGDRLAYRASELAAAESGLNRIASRVAQYDRQRRQSYRGELQPSPVKYSPLDSKDTKLRSSDRKGKAKENRYEFPSQNLTISRPRPLSVLSSSSTSSLRSISSPINARRVTISARRGPAFSNASRHTHTHTASSSTAMTRRSHTERELMRVKNVGLVATRRTPTPTPSTGSFAARQSMRIDSIDYSDSQDSPSPSAFRRPFRDSSSLGPPPSPLRGEWKVVSENERDTREFLRAKGGKPSRGKWNV